MDEHSKKHLHLSQTASQWESIGVHHHHGINIPLFSLHSNESCGIGEFTDLIPLFPWCKEIGIDVIQLLPLNDTGPDASPYSAISAFALNPIHLGLLALPRVHECEGFAEIHEKLKACDIGLRVNYKEVRPLKYAFFREYYERERDRVVNSKEYQQFIKRHTWLDGYALFKSLKVAQGWKSWFEWDPVLQHPTKEVVDALIAEYAGEVEFHVFLQYLCFQQLSEVVAEAKKYHILLKGDIPILISPESADVWLHPKTFRFEYTAGSPPDMYTPEGQNWGFPIYDWEYLKNHHYHWWKQRLKVCENFYEICRLDHIIGFFRIWAIPPGHSATEGKFIPSDRNTWLDHGKEIMNMIVNSTTMLPIGEDLGDVPRSVTQFLQEFGIPGTKVLRWERIDGDENKDYLPFNEYPLVSMTTVSTHDSDTLQLWWQNSPREAEDFCKLFEWDYSPQLTPEQHYKILHASHHTTSLFHINLFQEYLSLFPDLKWEDPEVERVNVPGVVSDTNWSIRYRPSVEAIVAHDGLKIALRHMITHPLATPNLKS
ncbi:MAG: 4-alpha-glucanotransferase [Chlamydiales bacterium]